MTTLFPQTGFSNVPPIDAPEPRKKRSWLPLLTVLFLLSYGLMTMLIVEQGQTIESQRALIRELFRDSTELTTGKLKAQQDKMAAAKRHNQNPSSQIQDPSTQAAQTPSSQAAPKQNQTAKSKPEFQAPSRPAADQANELRALVKI